MSDEEGILNKVKPVIEKLVMDITRKQPPDAVIKHFIIF